MDCGCSVLLTSRIQVVRPYFLTSYQRTVLQVLSLLFLYPFPVVRKSRVVAVDQVRLDRLVAFQLPVRNVSHQEDKRGLLYPYD